MFYKGINSVYCITEISLNNVFLRFLLRKDVLLISCNYFVFIVNKRYVLSAENTADFGSVCSYWPIVLFCFLITFKVISIAHLGDKI